MTARLGSVLPERMSCASLLLAVLATHGALAQIPPMPTVTLPPGGAGSVCVASASASTWRACGNTVLSAFASAYKEGCSAQSLDQLVAVTYPHMKVAAEAIVAVRVKAFAACSTTGNAYGCAAASAFASSTAKSIINIVSTAIATAVNSCSSCAVSSATATADIFTQLVVQIEGKVSAVVSGTVCIGPNQSTPAIAYSACTSQVYAHSFVFALAQAMIQGGCTNMDATATAAVGAMVQVDTCCDCTGYAYVCPSAGGACSVKKQAVDYTASLAGFKAYPAVYSCFTAECAASSVSTQLA